MTATQDRETESMTPILYKKPERDLLPNEIDDLARWVEAEQLKAKKKERRELVLIGIVLFTLIAVLLVWMIMESGK